MSARKKIALLFNHSIPHTTGQHVRAALKDLCDFDLYKQEEAPRLIGSSYDLYLCIDDSSHRLFPAQLKPSAVWLIDSQVTYRADRIMARRFDHVFNAQKDGAEKMRRDGIATAAWLPLGTPPDVYPKERLPKKYDVAFVGGIGWGRRRRLLLKLKERFKNSFIGQATPEQWGRIYREAKVVFNDSPVGNLNMRVFEALGSGSCMVANLDAFGLTDLFTPGVHFVGFGSEEEAIPAVERTLADDAGREKVAEAGRRETLAHHTYRHRMEEVLRRVFSPRPDEPKPLGPTWRPRALDRLRIKALETCYKVEWHLRELTHHIK